MGPNFNLSNLPLLLFFLLLICAAVIDARTKRIPPVIPLLILVLSPWMPGFTLLSGILGGLALGGILLLYDIIVPGAFGGGDIKLCGAVGLAVGLTTGAFGLLFALMLSLPVCLFLQITKRKKHIAFGPYLAVGFIVSTLLF